MSNYDISQVLEWELEDHIREVIVELNNRIMDLEIKVEEMEYDVAFLDCLSAAGVDNWDGYEYAQEMMDE